jgi:7-carboxy-7-deazaguanine synthase
MLKIIEQFKSIQGESTFVGVLCSFIRLAGCNLRCSYCDTRYAAGPGAPHSFDDILSIVKRHDCRFVEVTGGEPLLQEETPELCRLLVDHRYTVLVETNGSLDISKLPPGCIRIVDVKCPLSGMGDSFNKKNLDFVLPSDQFKFVISGWTDFDWAREFVITRRLHEQCVVIFSPVQGIVSPKELADWIIDTAAPVRLGLQLHYYIWGADVKGH